MIPFAAEVTTPDSLDTIFKIIQVPVFGTAVILFLWLYVTGRIVSGKEYDRVVKDRDKVDDERKQALQTLHEMLPVLAVAQEALRDATKAIERSEWERRGRDTPSTPPHDWRRD
jgi:hypothetical protein